MCRNESNVFACLCLAFVFLGVLQNIHCFFGGKNNITHKMLVGLSHFQG